MIQSKKIHIIVAVAVVFALIVSFALVGIGKRKLANGDFKTEPEYATKIFGTDIISIEIFADEDDWQQMLDNAINEEFIKVDVIVNGEKFRNVGIRPKGNSSLTQVAASDSDRYSFRLQFDEYVKGQTCFGLESFVVNNMIQDNTYMKEYISYDLMREAGVDAPYFGYANIKVNGENWGLYLAVELYNDSYEERVFGDTSGMLYNVKSMDMGGGGGNRPGGNFPAMPDMQNGAPPMPFDGQFPQMPNAQQGAADNAGENGGENIPGNMGGQAFAPPDGNAMPDFPAPPGQGNGNADSQTQNGQGQREGRTNNQRGRGGPGSSGGSLEYTDDNIQSYGAIFNNVVGKGADSDYRRVIKALKALSEGTDLETYFDVDQILRYLAAHTIVVNLDSYSSSMAQNYYIYERDGKLTILPWDYNLAWGGFQRGDASSVINFPIDTPVSGVELSSRPLIAKLFENPEYLERYHGYLQQLIDNYFADGKFEEKVKSLDALISDYVKNDPTAFCTYEEYQKAVSAFITLGNLRAQSVQGQLDGTIPSTTEGQKENPSLLVSAGTLSLSDLGSMGGGRGPGEGGGPFGNWKQNGQPQSNAEQARQQQPQQQPSPQQQEQPQPQQVQLGQQQQQRAAGDNIPRMGFEGQNGNVPMGPGVRNRQEVYARSLWLIGGLSLALLAAVIFAARFPKRY